MIGNAEQSKIAKPARDDFICPNCKFLWAYHPVVPGTSDFYCHIYRMEKVTR